MYYKLYTRSPLILVECPKTGTLHTFVFFSRRVILALHPITGQYPQLASCVKFIHGPVKPTVCSACETQLVTIIENLMRNSLAGSQTDLVLLDFSKAFDKVNHQKLLLELYHYGIRGPSLKWIQAFLSGRTHNFVLENKKSDTVPVTSGVPQGTVQGPILFLIYINDLQDKTRSKIRLFADDTAIYLAVSNHQDAQILQQDLYRLHEWELQWDMDFNLSKCVVIRARTPIANEYMLHGQNLE